MHYPQFDPILLKTIIYGASAVFVLLALIGSIVLFLHLRKRRQEDTAAIKRIHGSWMRQHNELELWLTLNRHQSLETMEAQRFIQAELSTLEYLSIKKPLNEKEIKRREWLVSVMDSNKVVEFPNK